MAFTDTKIVSVNMFTAFSKIIFSLTWVLFFTNITVDHSYATTFANRPLGVVVNSAENIVRGKAGESYADWDTVDKKRIFTYTSLLITEVLKGVLTEKQILIRQPGGSKDGIEMGVPGVANFVVGEDVVLQKKKKNQEDSSYDIPGFTTGKYNVKRDQNGDF